jgi:hypothetical protein
MFVFTPINESLYEKVATEITYCKLFPLILEDFVTRADLKQFSLPSNLIVSGSGGGPAPVVGVTTPIYNGSVAGPESQALKVAKNAIKEAGGSSIKGITDTGLGK